MRHFKILVIGPQGSGKTTIIRHVTKDTVTTDVKGSTVGLDFGIFRNQALIAHLFGSPGMAQFGLVRKALSSGSDGVILVVDSTNYYSIKEGEKYLRDTFGNRLPPVVVAANKQDQANALTPNQIQHLLTINAPVFPTQAHKGIGLDQLLTGFLNYLVRLGKGYKLDTLLEHT